MEDLTFIVSEAEHKIQANLAVSAAPDQELTPPRNESNFPTLGSDLAAVGIWRSAVKLYTHSTYFGT
jgi:hypothetical protein